MKIPLFKEGYIISLMEKLAAEESISDYERNEFTVDDNAIISNNRLEISEDLNLDPEKTDLENAIELYEKTLNMDRTTASDGRFWAYMSHKAAWNYMKSRYPLTAISNEKKAAYILRHWFLNGGGTRAIFDHGIAKLWWSVFITVDKDRADKYELTKEWFSHEDYTRVMGGFQARNSVFLHSFLEYVIKNKSLFNERKEAKIRYLMRMLNRVGGHSNLPVLSKEEMHMHMDAFKKKAAQVKD